SQILAPTAQQKSLTEIAVREGFQQQRHGTGVVVVGVDASTWFYACQAVFTGKGRAHTHAGQNPELRILFFRLAWLSRAAVSAIFIFDGENRPKRKRGKTVRPMPHWLTSAFKEFISGFGFQFYTATGEAEAELAYRNQIGDIDIILTNDSDVFLFGAKQVIRSPQGDKDLDIVSVYTTEAFVCQASRLFTTDGFLFLAVVNGGDYNPAGLPGCGTATATALASGPLAASLHHAAHSYSGQRLNVFLEKWRLQLKDQLIYDLDGRIGRKHPALGANIPPTFPDPEVLRLYAHPLTSQSNGVLYDTSGWFLPGVPNTSVLAALCDRLFDWGPVILKRFITNVWDGHCIRQLARVHFNIVVFC
ncbi:PIN domain-like protein, partial [Crassisporium funariophilum]